MLELDLNLRQDKARPLSAAEHDENFAILEATLSDLDDQIEALEAPDQAVPLPVGIFIVPVSTGNYFTATVDADDTGFTFDTTGLTAGSLTEFTLRVKQESGTFFFPAGVYWPNDRTPEPVAGNTHLFIFHTTNLTTWYGAYLLNYPVL